MDGWIKLYRKILDNPINCKDSDYFSVWIYLLLNATHTEYDTIFKGERITIKSGQLITGRKVIAEKFKIDEYKVQRILKTLEKQHQIAQQTSNKNRLISILNWNEYQEERHQTAQQVHNKCTTSAQQVHTNKNDKNIKNEKNDNNNIAEIDRIFIETIGSTNINNIKECIEYLDKLPIEVIEYALKVTARNNAKWNYARTILDSYAEKGLNTLEKIQSDEIQFKNKNNTKPKEETEEEKIARKKRELEEGLKNAKW